MARFPALSRYTSPRYSCHALVLLLMGVAGCGSIDSTVPLRAANDSNIKRLANLYLTYQMQNGFSAPKDETTFRAFIRDGMPVDKLQVMQIDAASLDGLFTSERDRRPFIIRYGLQARLGMVTPVVFETEGVGGKRQVAFTNGLVEEVSDVDHFRALLEDPGQSTFYPQKADP